jgi:hypothetical protein
LGRGDEQDEGGGAVTANTDNIPIELRQIPQWVGWKSGRARADGKRPKLPINPRNGRTAKSDDPATWGDFAAALAAVERFALEGVGFMFAEGGEYTGIDFDNCIVGGVIVPQVEGVLGVLDSYAEISPSGEGIKVWVKGTKPTGAGCRCAGVLGCKQVEIYDKGRFFTVTGRHWAGTPATVEARQAALDDLCRELWPEPTGAAKGGELCQVVIAPNTVSQLAGSMEAMERCWRCILKMRPSVDGDGGHNALLAAACTCFRFALNEAQAREILARFNIERCIPPWPEADLDRKLSEGFKKVEAKGQFGELLHKLSAGEPKRWHNHLPQWILDIPRLRPVQRVILQAIADRCDRHPIDAAGSLATAIVGFKGLAELCGICERTCIRHVTQLLAMGVLARMSRGGIRFDTGECVPNTYAIPGQFGALEAMTDCQSLPSPTTGLPDGSVSDCHSVRETVET